jgi:hypothetical protein
MENSGTNFKKDSLPSRGTTPPVQSTRIVYRDKPSDKKAEDDKEESTVERF